MMNGRKSTAGVALALLLGHPRAQELLVAVGGEQRAHERRGLVGHLAERIAREVGPGVLVVEPLAEVAQPPR